jgi:hypothetical protein
LGGETIKVTRRVRHSLIFGLRSENTTKKTDCLPRHTVRGKKYHSKKTAHVFLQLPFYDLYGGEEI